jgi:hypothetical protein
MACCALAAVVALSIDSYILRFSSTLCVLMPPTIFLIMSLILRPADMLGILVLLLDLMCS